MGWYQKEPELFDQKTDDDLFKFFIYRFCGFKGNIVADQRIEAWNWETILRSKRLLVSEGKIKLSEESQEARHIESERTKKVVVPDRVIPQYRFVENTAIRI